MTDPTVTEMWQRFRTLHPDAPDELPLAYHFCDNSEDARVCAELVVQGQKQATAASLAELALAGDPVAQPGDYAIVTDFEGKARAVIRTTKVEVCRLGDVDAQFAWDEGEGDRSLAWWREAHLAYYRRVLANSGVPIDDELMIACERFETLFTGKTPAAATQPLPNAS